MRNNDKGAKMTKSDRYEIRLGDVVRYSDMANAPRDYIVRGQIGTDFQLTRVEDHTVSTSDLRQSGWTLVRSNGFDN